MESDFVTADSGNLPIVDVLLSKITNKISETYCTQDVEMYWLNDGNADISTPSEPNVVDSESCTSKEVCYMENCRLGVLIENFVLQAKNTIPNLVLKNVMLEQKPDFNKVLIINGFKTTLLNYATMKNNTVFVQELIKFNLDVYRVDSNGNTALHNAVTNKNIHLIQIITKQNTSGINIQNNEKETALFISVKLNHLQIFRVILSRGADPYISNAAKETTLHVASEQGMLTILREILDKTTSGINKQAKGGITALHAATSKNQLKSCELLLKSGALPYISTDKGHTPLHIAASYGRLKIAELLLNYSTNLTNYKSKEGDSALLLAVKRNQTETCKLLLEKGADPNIPNNINRTALHEAAQQGLLEIAHILINTKNIEIDSRDINGETALHLSASENHVNLCELLLNARANPTILDNYGYTPLHNAVFYGQLKTVELLLNYSTNLTNYRTEDGDTALLFAVKGNWMEICKLLLENGADPNIPNNINRTALHEAALQGLLEIAQILINTKNIEIDSQDEDGRTSLHLSALENHANMCEFLLNTGANPSILDNYGYTPLHNAAFNGQLNIVELFLNYSTNLTNCKSKEGDTALLLAVKGNWNEIFKLLLENGADPNIPNNINRTALHEAVLQGLLEIAQVLINTQSIKIDSRDKNGKTALHLSVLKNHIIVCKMLLNAGANPGIPDDYGQIPLHLAAYYRRLKITELLLKYSKNLTNHQSKEGDTALLLAVKENQMGICRLLLENGADPNIPNNVNRTALHEAALQGLLEIAELLLNTKNIETDTQDVQGKTALHLSASGNYISVCKMLLNAGANPGIPDDYGEIPLHLTIYQGKLNMVELFLNYSTHLTNYQSKEGDTALLLAVKKNKVDISKLLLENGADPNIPDNINRTALHEAALQGLLEIAQILINTKNIEIDSRDVNGETALHLSASENHVTLCELLLNARANPRILDNYGYTPLHNAAFYGQLKIVELLLNYSTNLTNYQTEDGDTALLLAVKENEMDICKLLLENGADPNIPNNINRTALHEAALQGLLQIAELLLNTKNIKIDSRDKNGETALHLSASGNYISVCEVLLNAGANPGIPDDYGQIPLHLTIYHGQLKIVELFLNYSTHLTNYQSKEGDTALLLAVKENQMDICKLLLEKGADPNIPNDINRTALHVAALQGLLEIAQILISTKNIETDTQDVNGETALHLSVSENHISVCEVLLNAGANHRIPDRHGNTPVHVAAMRGHIRIFRVISMRHFTGVNDRNSQGQTPLFLATYNNYIDVVNILLDMGADPTLHTNKGWVPLHASASRNLSSIAELLLSRNKMVINSQTYMMETALHLASRYNFTKLCYILIRNGATSQNDILWFTPFYNAASNGNIELMNVLISKHAISINTQSFHGTTPLMVAALRNHTDAVKYLIENGADSFLTDHVGQTVLHYVAKSGIPPIIRMVLDYSNVSILNVFDDFGKTPAQEAVDNNYLALETILERKTELFLFPPHYETPLHTAASDNNLKGLKLILKKFPVTINHLGKGFTPLQVSADASKYCHSSILRYLLDEGADPFITGDSGMNIFHRTSGSCGWNVFEMLYDRLAKRINKTEMPDRKFGDFLFQFLNKKDILGRAPLWNAAYYNNFEGFYFLFRKRGNLKTFDAFGCSMLIPAAHGGNNVIIDLILNETNLFVDSGCSDGLTPLMVAAANGHIKTFEYLLTKGANINAVTAYGNTLLHYAVAGGSSSVNIMHHILRKGQVSINSQNAEDYTPLMLAVQSKNDLGVKLLLQNNVDFQLENIYHENAAILAAREGNLRILKLLEHSKFDSENLLGIVLARQLTGIKRELWDYLLNKSSIVRYPLFYAAAKNNFTEIEALLSMGSVRKTKKFPTLMKGFLKHYHNAMSQLLSDDAEEEINHTQLTPLDISILFSGSSDCVSLLREKLGEGCASLNYRKGMWTTLDFALFSSGGLNTLTNFAAQHLLDFCRSYLSQPTNEHLWTLAHKAAWTDNTVILELLFRLGVDLNKPDKFLRTPLHVAAINGAFFAVRTILRLTKDSINSIDVHGFTPLHLTQIYQYEKLFLRMSTVSITLPFEEKFKLIQRSVESGFDFYRKLDHIDITKTLLVNGADLDIQDKAFGWTALHWAAATGNLENVALLIHKGARVNINSWTEETAMAVARKWGRRTVYHYFKSKNGVW